MKAHTYYIIFGRPPVGGGSFPPSPPGGATDRCCALYELGGAGTLFANNQGPDLQNVLRQSYDYLTIMPELRSTYDRRLIHKSSYEGRMAFLR